MKRYLRTSSLYSTIAVFVLLVVSFQNCARSSAPVNFEYKSSSSVATDSSGNGGTYDGKPTGTYIRRSPSACAASNNWIGILNLGETSAELASDLCVALDYVIELVDTRLEFSAFNPDYVGLNAAIFERSETATPAADAPYVDLWCHYQDSDFGLDVVVKTNSTTRTSESIVYVGESLSSSSPQARKLNGLPTTKSSTAGRLVASSNDGTLSTEVDISNPDAMKYPGRAIVRLDNKDLNLTMSCRVVSNEAAVLVKPSSALAIYQMDQSGAAANGSSIIDSSSGSRDAVLNNSNSSGAQFVSGLIGNALTFDGIDDNIDLTSLSPQTASGFTFSAWVQPSTLVNDKAVLFGIFDPFLTPPSYYNTLRIGFGLCSPSPDVTADRYHLTMDLGSPCYGTGINIVDGQWHMVSLTVAGSQVTLYLDGAQVGQYTLSNPRIPSTDIWALGQDWDSATNQNDRYRGLVDEVTVWGVALTPTEIAEAFKNSAP